MTAMSRTKSEYFVRFGPAIPTVPVTRFSRMFLTSEQWEDAWSLCGPSVERNMTKLELWQVIASAYLEGLQHGSSLAKEGTADHSRNPLPHEC